ncbi:MAG: hypothetical protein IBX55_22090, partial [Methyloprofundus sp.]|nr:hypothetical protein [Methyloprofundus sp.]
MEIFLFIVRLSFLIIGAEALVRGASRLAAVLGISPLVIGLTVVAFGTSSPELAVSVKSALSGQANIALGNVIGSNIFNVLFILGLSALIVPLVGLAVVNQKKTTIFGLSTKVKRYMHLAASCFLPIKGTSEIRPKIYSKEIYLT